MNQCILYPSSSCDQRLHKTGASVRALLGGQVKSLRCPPVPEETNQFVGSPFDTEAGIGIPVPPFPRWMLCTLCRLLAPLSTGLFELKTDPFRPERARYVHHCQTGRKSPTVVPARFIVACTRARDQLLVTGVKPASEFLDDLQASRTTSCTSSGHDGWLTDTVFALTYEQPSG